MKIFSNQRLGLDEKAPASMDTQRCLVVLSSLTRFFSFAELIHNLFHLILRDSCAVGHTVAWDRAQVRRKKK